MQSKNASVKESEIRRFVNNLVNIHTPLLDTWFDRDHVEVPGIPDDQQTDYVSHDSASGVQSLISISKEEAAPLRQRTALCCIVLSDRTLSTLSSWLFGKIIGNCLSTDCSILCVVSTSCWFFLFTQRINCIQSTG